MSSRPPFNRRAKLLLLSTAALLANSATVFAVEEVSVTDVKVPDRSFQFGFSESVRNMQGGFDAYGNYAPLPAGSTSLTFTSIMSVDYRLSPQWEAGLRVPFRDSRMITPSGDSASRSLGGPSADVRYHLEDWTHTILHGGISAPWSMASAHVNGDPHAALTDDIGDGMMGGTSVHFGVGVSRVFHPVRVAFDVSTTVPFASTNVPTDAPEGSPEVTIQRGKRLQLSEGAAYLFNKAWGVHAGFKQVWAGDTYVNGSDMAGTASRAFSTGVGASYAYDAVWHFTTNVETQYPFYAYAVNQSYSPTVSISMIHNGF